MKAPRALLAASCLLLAGCGTERAQPADPLAVKEPGDRVRATEPRTGLSIEVPSNWQRDFRALPGIFRIFSGAAQVSGWAYERTEALPGDGAELAAAEEALVAESKRRNATLEVDRSRTFEVAGAPAIEITGTQTIDGSPIRTRSVHFFRDGYEYVIEALSPPAAFGRTDRGVLQPLLESVRFGSPAG